MASTKSEHENNSSLNGLILPTFQPIQHNPISGTHINLQPLQPSHAQDLWPEISGDANANLWTYMPLPTQHDPKKFQTIITEYSSSTDPLFYAIITPHDNHCKGYISFLRIDNTHRTIEIGHVLYTRALQRTTAASEAVFLLARTAFEHGYRRLEWKCNALNAPSQRAALRYGFTYEGMFRQHMLVKGANRNTAWFSIVDGEWGLLRRAFEKWIDASNFDDQGRQIRTLEQVRSEI